MVEDEGCFAGVAEGCGEWLGLLLLLLLQLLLLLGARIRGWWCVGCIVQSVVVLSFSLGFEARPGRSYVSSVGLKRSSSAKGGVVAPSDGGAHFGGQLSSMHNVERDVSRELAGVGISGSGSQRVGI